MSKNHICLDAIKILLIVFVAHKGIECFKIVVLGIKADLRCKRHTFSLSIEIYQFTEPFYIYCAIVPVIWNL